MSADYKKAREFADKLLKDLCLTTPPIPILEVAENCGLKVLETTFNKQPKISGLIDIDEKIIYVNQDDHPSHKRFTIAHEIGHWLLHPLLLNEDPSIVVYYRIPMGSETDDREKEANCFAANLLVPLNILLLLQDFYSNEELANLFAVSPQVIRYRQQAKRSL